MLATSGATRCSRTSVARCYCGHESSLDSYEDLIHGHDKSDPYLSCRAISRSRATDNGAGAARLQELLLCRNRAEPLRVVLVLTLLITSSTAIARPRQSCSACRPATIISERRRSTYGRYRRYRPVGCASQACAHYTKCALPSRRPTFYIT